MLRSMVNHNIGSRGKRWSIEDRFWKKVNDGIRLPDDVCWPWTGARTRLGYGNFWDGTYTDSNQPRMVEAHRWAFSHFIQAPGELHVLHSCDNRWCVNYIRCLHIGTHLENMRERDARGRGRMPERRGFVRGHGRRFTAEEVRSMRADYTGKRGDISRIARQYNTGHQTISSIIRGKSWHEEDVIHDSGPDDE